MEFEKRKLEWLEFDLLEPFAHVAHGVFSRHGGASKGPFGTLNTSTDVGDHPDTVKVNREAVRKTMDVPKIVFAQQKHGTNVHRVTSKNCDKVPVADAL